MLSFATASIVNEMLPTFAVKLLTSLARGMQSKGGGAEA
jgi:hypothetical protein